MFLEIRAARYIQNGFLDGTCQEMGERKQLAAPQAVIGYSAFLLEGGMILLQVASKYSQLVDRVFPRRTDRQPHKIATVNYTDEIGGGGGELFRNNNLVIKYKGKMETCIE